MPWFSISFCQRRLKEICWYPIDDDLPLDGPAVLSQYSDVSREMRAWGGPGEPSSTIALLENKNDYVL